MLPRPALYLAPTLLTGHADLWDKATFLQISFGERSIEIVDQRGAQWLGHYI
jgi:hypothetical protein